MKKVLREKQSLEKRRAKYYLVDLWNDNMSADFDTVMLGRLAKRHPDCHEEYQFALIKDGDDKAIRFMKKEDLKDLWKDFTTFKMFGKAYRSHFSYWFAHWCAFQMTALNFGIWKPKYLLHDIEKPWKLLISRDYSKVQESHRKNHKHHTEYGLEHGWDKMDWEAAVIDWECSRFTKQAAQMDARETLEALVSKPKWHPYEKIIREGVEPILYRHGI
jgi:hypothetical protein